MSAQEHDELTIARIDPASEISEGNEAEFWLDTRRIHYFDADTGENLLPRPVPNRPARTRLLSAQQRRPSRVGAGSTN